MGDEQILVLGANGQLGKQLRINLPGARALDRQELDITNWKQLEAYDWSGLKVIINAAAYTNVDQAETPKGRRAAWQVNAQAAAHLARIASTHGLTLVHVSSDYVFDGSQSPHTEQEPLTPLGVYGQSKAAGDIAVATTAKHYIVRTSWVIGDGPNFVRTMMGLASKNVSPKVVSDQVGRLSFTDTLAEGIQHLLSAQAPFGTYNLSNDGDPASWAEITRVIFSELGRDDLVVSDVTTADYFKDKPLAAPRPLQSSLDLTKIKQVGFTPPDWRGALSNYITKEKQ